MRQVTILGNCVPVLLFLISLSEKLLFLLLYSTSSPREGNGFRASNYNSQAKLRTPTNQMVLLMEVGVFVLFYSKISLFMSGLLQQKLATNMH